MREDLGNVLDVVYWYSIHICVGYIDVSLNHIEVLFWYLNTYLCRVCRCEFASYICIFVDFYVRRKRKMSGKRTTSE